MLAQPDVCRLRSANLAYTSVGSRIGQLRSAVAGCNLSLEVQRDIVARPSAIVVDDSRLSRRMLRDLLERVGFNIALERSSAHDIVDACAIHVPDALIIDSRVPGIEWSDALEMIRDRVPHIAIVDVRDLTAGEIESAILHIARATELGSPLNWVPWGATGSHGTPPKLRM